ncbi:bacillithiol biosynthesis cysteine-adding enzyme BshC [Flavobacterium channae]|uniref:bacillithiol biosynthesis cysteine-adding enzyme BshC n=1 Tax=Flavobacterium channae TaxID=2897181 RepID=UPI001E36DEB0|nr:bacillithiol biosynthesis cysteine-adding enzyme BshC [Flavobacterium channae]UGS24417.1 bacillithiol biosynthesis cysteine-adding enzyme BshC [Flavobacterium channae]
MPNDCITYQNSGYFSRLIVDYLDQKTELKSLYNRFPTINNFKLQIEEKNNNFPIENRAILVDALKKQYEKFIVSEETLNHIDLLNQSNTFTITTGHQLNLFTGPLYFLYKIISVINLTKELKAEYPDYNFVPVYWMATEDHDFDEINFFNFKNKKIQWKKESSGPVGRLNTSGLDEVFEVFSNELGLGDNAFYLKELFKKSYLEHNNLADATRYLTNELFKNNGLVIIDGDDKNLKKLFIPYVKNELIHQTSYKKVTDTLPLLQDYDVQVNPREINLFYIQDNLRERIIFENGNYKINNSSLTFSEREILTELENRPENFSPNVILRPLYQEVILPNLCYIGGGGEIAYWLELKSNFEENNVTFPILLLRNSVLIATKKQEEKMTKLNLSWAEVFEKQDNLINKKTEEFSSFTIDFSNQKKTLEEQFKLMYEIANKTDKSFLGAVKAQEAKQLKGLDKLEKRLLKAEKRNHSEKLERIIQIQNELFPNQTLQERKANFALFYNEINNFEAFFSLLKTQLQPLTQNFSIVII